MVDNANRQTFVEAPGWMVFGVPAFLLTILAWVALGGLDRELFLTFNSLSQYTGRAFWAHATILGDGLICAVLLLPWIRKHPERVWGGLLGALIMFVILRTFKATLSIPRPLAGLPEDVINVIGPGHRRSSFPSGHTSTIFLYSGIWALSIRKRLYSLALILPAILVGISRIAVGVHWPSDVLAGAALGWVSAWLGLRWAGTLAWGRKGKGQWILGILLMISALVMAIIDHTGYPGVIWFQRTLAVTCLSWGVVEMIAGFRASRQPVVDQQMSVE